MGKIVLKKTYNNKWLSLNTMLMTLFLSLAVGLYGQKKLAYTVSRFNENSWGNKSTIRPIVEPVFSIYTFQNRINSKSTLLNNQYSVGVNGNATATGDIGFLGLILAKEFTLSFNYFLPTIKNHSDTVFYKTNGFNFSINYGKDLFYENKTIDVLPTYGYGFSSFKLEQNRRSEVLRYKNPAFIFNFLLEVRINLFKHKRNKLVSLGAKGGYPVDCSNPNWRKNHKTTTEISKPRQTGTFVQTFISLNL